MDFDMSTVDSGAVAWVLTSAALVLLMTPGIAFYYGGMTQAKHVLSMIMQSFMIMAIVGLVWIVVAYSLAFGKGNQLIGDLQFAGLFNMNKVVPGYEENKMVVPPLVFVIFQMMFAVITPALITGATAARWRFGAFVSFMVLWPILVYAPIAHWVFSPVGFARHIMNSEVLDFAGGTVVHANAGAAGLAMALVLGRRAEWPENKGSLHNMPFVMLGTAMLWFGWFGFNAGSALRPDLVAATAFINTNTATAAAVLTWVFIERIKKNGKATTFAAASGAVAGLVAITPCAGFIKPLEAIIVGIVATLGGRLAIKMKDRLGYDDALDVVSLHLVCGVIGSLSLGFLAAGHAVNPTSAATGLLHGGGFRQLAVQSIAVVAVVMYSFAVTYIIGWLIGLVFGNGGKVLPEQERKGLDQSLHGESAYTLTETISATTPTGV